jgi:protein-tyrosine phosphatase
MEMKDQIKSELKKILPDRVVRSLQEFRQRNKPERALLIKVAALRQIGVRPKLVPPTARSLLFVCYGNIMRSPMCEALMRRAVTGSEGFRIASAGLSATPARPAHPWAVEAAREFGIRLENHRARMLDVEMVEKADAVLVMDFRNYVQVVSKYPNSKKKTFFLGAYANDAQGIEIRDPYYLGLEATSRCFHVLNQCISALLDSVRPKVGAAPRTTNGAAVNLGPPADPARETRCREILDVS